MLKMNRTSSVPGRGDRRRPPRDPTRPCDPRGHRRPWDGGRRVRPSSIRFGDAQVEPARHRSDQKPSSPTAQRPPRRFRLQGRADHLGQLAFVLDDKHEQQFGCYRAAFTGTRSLCQVLPAGASVEMAKTAIRETMRSAPVEPSSPYTTDAARCLCLAASESGDA